MYIKIPIVQLAKQNREIAIKNGDRFYEGKPCKKAGHTKRYVNVKNPNSHGGCVECSVIRHQKTHVPLEDMTDENVKKIRKERRRKDLIKTYGITPEDWIRLYEEQGGKCKNLRCDFTHHDRWWEQGRQGFHVHHNHETGIVVGLFCGLCNFIEGILTCHPNRIMGMIEVKRLHDESTILFHDDGSEIYNPSLERLL